MALKTIKPEELLQRLISIYSKCHCPYRVLAYYEEKDKDKYGAGTAAEEHFEATNEVLDLLRDVAGMGPGGAITED